MTTTTKTATAVSNWEEFYTTLTSQGGVPNASIENISSSLAMFRNMYLNLATIQSKVSGSNSKPVLITIYADVLEIPDGFTMNFDRSGIIIYARLINVLGKASLNLDFTNSNNAQALVFCQQVNGSFSIEATNANGTQSFAIKTSIDQKGISVEEREGKVQNTTLTFEQGFSYEPEENMIAYFDNAFIYGSLMYDQEPAIALNIFRWIKAWAAVKDDTNALFYRSASMVTLLASQVNAKKNGARFVPYLSSDIYTTLATAFSKEAELYEKNYNTLSTQNVLTQENIEMAKTMIDNSQSEINYTNALLKQANNNYNNAIAAAKKSQTNFKNQKREVDIIAIDFKDVGIPEYEREQIIKAIFGIFKAVITFGGAVAAMAVGDEAAAPAAAEGAIEGAEAIAEGAEVAEDVAKTAKEIAELMKTLKKLLETIKQIYELAESLKEVIDDIGSATSQKGAIQKIADVNNGVDLTAADAWKVYQIKADSLLQGAVDKGIEYAQDYKNAMDILAIYGQSQLAAQLAVIKATQEVASLSFKLEFAKEKKANLEKLVNSLNVGDAPILAMMQQFYQKYLDAKSMMFSSLKSYQDSFFYWALKESNIQPKIIDPVKDLTAGISQLTSIALDKAQAEQSFNPAPGSLDEALVEITEPNLIKEFIDNGAVTIPVKLTNSSFQGLSRVRLNTVRVWLEGVQFSSGHDTVYLDITTCGNYLDFYNKLDYQFNSADLNRPFKYRVGPAAPDAKWSFADGSQGFVELDGDVADEVSYAYFRPTPFSEWTVSAQQFNTGIDFSKVSKITFFFKGSAIGLTS